jgi:hypothetical protein
MDHIRQIIFFTFLMCAPLGEPDGCWNNGKEIQCTDLWQQQL